MSKNNEKKDATIVHSTLFDLFKPDLYFNEPRISLKEGWYVIAEQVAPFSRNEFWQTIRCWTAEPQYAIPPIEKAEIKSTEENDNHEHNETSQEPVEIIVRELIPKRKSKDAILVERVEYFENDKEVRIVYQPVMPIDQALPFYYPKVKAYSFVYESGLDEELDSEGQNVQGNLRLEIVPFNTSEVAVSDSKMQYALKSILHKLFKWCIQNRLGYKKRAHHDVLVPKDTYRSMYLHIKSKYGQELVDNWTEQTDPKKFVYEDLAIASYLICLWKEEEVKTKRKATFIDLGCGNGLLTFLLVSEGYEGYGIDIADRKIWPRLCENHTNDMLKVEALYPAKITYPHTEWLIGNHADELVPWIPIIASKSGEHCKFMVIPCCFYGLDGTRSLSLPLTETVGKYRAYTDYIKDIAEKSGYLCEEDYLRIPSTKNIALVGRVKQKESNKSLLNSTVKIASESFVPRKTDREKTKERQGFLSKKPKLEK